MKVLVAIFLGLLSYSVSQVVDLTPDNFDTIIDGSKGAFVEFFAPWCGHCKTLAPEYEIVGESFSREKSVVIAKVDADAHKDLGGRFGVHGFPTLKYFPKGSKEPIAYEGGRSADEIISFVNEQAGTRVKVKKASTNVEILTDSTFDKIVMDKSKDVLVEFYAPWCGHCKHLAPIWEKLANAFDNEKSVVIANIDADKYRDIGERYGVSGFPTIKFFPKDNKDGVAYESGRELDDLVSYINEKAGTQRSSEGKLAADAGRVSALDAIASTFLSGDKKSLLSKAEDAVKALSDEAHAAAGKIYVKYMQTIVEKGNEWVATEVQRLERMLSGSVAPSKVDEFTRRKNILSSFQ